MGKPRILAIPFPAQGHVIPLVELVQCLVKQGFKVTFINTDFIPKRVINALSKNDTVGDVINLVSLPDRIEPGEDRNELGKLSQAISRVMPGKLEELIEKINGTKNEKVTCIIADECMGWALKVAEKMGIKRGAYWTAAAALLASILSIPKLIDDEIVGNDGTILKRQMIQLSPTMPALNPTDFAWEAHGGRGNTENYFQMYNKSYRIVCNSPDELEPATYTLFPNFLPIGPLLAIKRLGKQAGYFWPEDSTCLAWLDQQPPCQSSTLRLGASLFLTNASSKNWL